MPTRELDIAHHLDEGVIYDLLLAKNSTNVLIVSHELGLFELIGPEGISPPEVSSRLKISDRATMAILSVLRSNDLLELIDGVYFLSPLARKYLVRESPYYFGSVIEAVKVTGIEQVDTYQGLKNRILNDEVKYKSFDTFENDLERAAWFTRSMHQMSYAPSKWWIEKIDLSGGLRFLDIAGGSGAHAISALQKWPDLEAMVLDLEPVCKLTEQYFEQYGVGDRGKTLVYDLWNSELPPADAHFYSNIFHDWSYEQGRFLAQKSFDALESGGRILIHEMLYDDDKKGPKLIANYNVTMFLTMKGQQYSGKELTDLLYDIGFKQIEVIPTQGYWSIVTGTKP